MRRSHRLVAILVLALLPTGIAHAQHLEVGVAVRGVQPRDGSFASDVGIFPTVRLAPGEGWGFAGALNWFATDVDGATIANVRGPIGRLRVRPVMGGVGYTFRSPHVITSVSFVAGPSLNTFTAREGTGITVAGSGVERNAGSITVAFRPSVNVSIPVAPRLSVTGALGYLVNRPSIALNTPAGLVRQTWKTDAVVTSVGLVFRVF